MARSVLLSLTFFVTTAAFGADGFERVLIPVWGSLPGAFGSVWVAQLSSVNTSSQYANIALFPSLNCGFGVCPGDAGFGAYAWDTSNYGPFPRGHFLYIAQGRADDFQFSLLGYDRSRMNASFGSQIPVVRERQFSNRAIYLPNVPVAPGFRVGLRVYGLIDRPMPVRVRISGSTLPGRIESSVQLEPQNASSNEDVPSFAQVDISSLLPADAINSLTHNPFNEVGPPMVTIWVTPNSPDDFIWAFVTLTHNETQHFTAIGPQ